MLTTAFDEIVQDTETRSLIALALSDFAVAIVNAGGIITDWNSGAEEVFGYSREEAIGLPMSRLYTPEDIAAGIPDLELMTARERGRAPDKRWHLRKDGSRCWIDGVSCAVVKDGVPVYCKIGRDATAQKLAATQLAVQAATVAILGGETSIESAAPAVLRTICDELGWELGQLWLVETDGRAIRCVAAEHATGQASVAADMLCRGQLFGRGVGLPGEIWANAAPQWNDHLTSRRDLPRADLFRQFRFQTQTGFPVIVGGEVVAVLEFFTRYQRESQQVMLDTLAMVGSQLGQFIDRLRLQSSRQTTEQQYRVVAETAADAIVTIDGTSTVTYANPAVKEIFGWDPSELIGAKLDVIIPPGMRDAHRAGMRRYLETRTPHIPWNGVELPGLHRDGHEVTLDVSFGRVSIDGRDYFTGIMRDVSAKRKVEEENRRLYREAQEANRAKDEFLATVSHELRTPMTAVLGWTRLLKIDPDPETLREGLAAIERSASAQAQLIDDILDVSRITAGKLRFRTEPVQLDEVVRTAIETVRPTAEGRGVELLNDIPFGDFQIMGDATRLQQVVWNLLTNAIKFTPVGGQVVVTLRSVDDSARISVRDTGEGMASEFIPQLFERFRQAESSSKRSHGGLGLGLSIVKHLVELHGGTVWAESPGLGQGSTFHVELPLGVPEQGDSTVNRRNRRASDRAASLDGVHIIVVEDDADTRGFLVKVLTRGGGEVRAAGSVAEARQLLRSATPDVIVSDLAMPAEDGYDLIREVRSDERLRDLPMIAVTASGGAGDRERALAAGFDVYLRKPVEPSTLLETIVRQLKRETSSAPLRSDD